ncbi:tail host specificity protein J [Rhizobium phage RHph_TM16]|nr:tail host specificity protein J [Rhizobium phage RHph_TM16]
MKNSMWHPSGFPRMITGSKGGGKGSSGGGSESPNTLRSKATVRLLDMLGEGEIKGLVNGAKSIYLNETPLVSASGDYNFKGVNWDIRVGLPSQSVMPGASGVEAITNVGAQVKYGAPLTRSLTDPDYDACKVTIRIPALSKADDKGNINGTTLQFVIDIRYQGGAFTTSSGVITLTGKCTSPYDREFYFALPKNPGGASAPWEIRVTRLTPDSDSVKLQNDMYFSSFEGTIEAKFSYPYTAYVGMVVDGEQFNQQIPERKYLIDGRIIKVPSNYTTRLYDVNGNISRNPSYSGVWDGTFKMEWTNNPAWVFYDMVTNDRFGLGDYIDVSQVDKWGLYEIAKYCDEYVPNGIGGVEPRMTFNGVVATKREAYDTLSSMASCFRGMAYWSSGSIVTTQDRPKDPVVLASQSNVVDGQFDRQSTALKSRHTVAMAKFLNPQDFYREDYAIYQDEAGIAKYGYRDTKFEAVGCTSRGQAYRMAKWTVLTELYEKGTTTYQAGLDHAGVRPGDIIAIQDPSLANVEFGGRISGGKPELITNGFFGAGITGWTSSVSSGGAVTWGAGNVTIKGNGTTRSYIEQAITTEVGKTYRMQITPSGGQAVTVWVGTTQGASDLSSTTPSAYSEISFTATGTTTWLRFSRQPTTTVTIDNISVREQTNTPSVINVDTPVTFEGGNLYWLNVQMPDGSIEESNIVIAAYDTPTTQITVSPAFTKTPDAESQWIISRNDLVPELIRCITIKESEPNKYDVMGLQYEPSKFAAVDVDAQFSLINTSDFPTGELGVPTAPLFNEYAYALGQTGTIMALDWSITAPKDPRIGQFEWQYQTRTETGTLNGWQAAGFTYDPIITIQDLEAGLYNFRVRCLGSFGVGVSGWTVSNDILLQGLNLPPATPTQFRISVLGDQSQFTWRVANQLNIRFYEIRHTPNVVDPEWNSAVVLVKEVAASGIQLPTMAGTFLIKSVSFTGVYSLDAAMIQNGVLGQALNAVEVLDEATAGFLGTKGNTLVVSGDLQLKPYNGNFPPLGVYGFNAPVDLGDEYTSRLSATIDIFGLDVRDTIDKWTSLDTVTALSTARSDQWSFELEYATTLDNPVAVVARASTGTYFDADGILKTAANNVPRYNYTPSDLSAVGVLLAEAAGTNLILQSQTFDNASWTKTNLTVTANAIAAVDGTTTADKLTEDTTASAVHQTAQQFAVTSGQSYVGSTFFKAGSAGRLLRVTMGAAFASNCWASFDPVTELVTLGADAVAAGFIKCLDGNYRVWVKGTATSTGNATLYISMQTSTSPVYTGDGTSFIYVWGAQAEQGAAMTSYIPTTTATVTRAAETITSQPTWTDWEQFITRDVNFRAIKFRAKLISNDPAVTPVLRGLTVNVDMPDRIIAGNDIAVPTAGLSIVFDPPFKGLTGLSMASQDMATGDRALITAKSENGFTIRYFNSTGTAVARTFDYNAVGYGVKK